jgi:hypothetical protein
MMKREFLEDRRKALEEAFFAEHNKKLLQKLQENAAKVARKEAISKVIDICDDAILDQLVEAGLCCETVVALQLIPLLEVAWADGTIQKEEHDAILRAAEEHGVGKDTVAHELLEGWLSRPIDAKVMQTWKGFIQALKEQIDTDAYTSMKNDAMTLAHKVAEAAGGFLGLSKVSAKEKAMLEELEAAF